mmetsp:Transcript_10240/g.41702  ORF Transcript_10240/g.41702 Transcript_10240/m.41702 type:complete len:1397 (+) Transcript_10240:115-4305(+)
MAAQRNEETEDDAVAFYKRSYSAKRVLSNRLRCAPLEELVVVLSASANAAELRQSLIATYHVVPDLTGPKLLSMVTSIYLHPNLSIKTGEADYEGAEELPLPSATDIRRNVVKFLCEWLRSFFDFLDDPALFSQLKKWAAKRSKAHPGEAELQPLTEAIAEFESRKASRKAAIKARAAVNAEDSSGEGSGDGSTFSLLSGKYSVEVIAQQLTTLEHRLVNEIRPREYLVAWESMENQGGLHDAPNLTCYLDHFKAMRGYIISEVSKHQSPKSHAQAIKKAIQIAQYCISYNNFNTTMEILSALFSPVIIDPKKAKTWELLNSRWFEILEQLSNLMSPDDAHKNYRAALMSAGERCVPFLGVHVEDMRFIMDFNPTQTLEGLNIGKLLQLKSELVQLRNRCEDEYSFPSDPQFVDQLLGALSATPAVETLAHPMPGQGPRSSVDQQESDEEAVKADKKDARGEKKEAKPEKKNRMQELWTFSENFYSDASLIGSHFVAVKDFQLRERDHRVLSTGASVITFEEGTVIIEEGLLTTDAAVCLLTVGTVTLERGGALVRSVSSPCLLNHTSVLQTGQTTPLYKASTKVELYIIDRKFLMSVLESDADLSLHFFTDLAFSLIEELTRNRLADKGGGRSRKASNRLVNRVRALSQTGSSQRIPQTIRPAKPNKNLGRIMDPKMQRDQEFFQLFDGIIDEVILREYRATMLGRTLNVQGTLFISQAHLCFYAKIFNHKSKAVIPLAQLCSISQKKNKLMVEWTLNMKRRKAVFRLRDEDTEVVGLINSISASLASEPARTKAGARSSVDSRLEKAEAMEGHTSSLESWKGANSLALTAGDWELILRGAKRISFKKDSAIVVEGSATQRIFQVAKGHCRIEKQQSNGPPLVLGTIGSSEIFGEMGFVLCQPASASVVAESEEVELYVIEGFYLSRLMQMRIELLARFLHYICTIMERRLMSRNRLEDQEERKVVDIITEPLHLNLVRHPVVPLAHPEPIHVICGPAETDLLEVENCYSSAQPFCAGTAVSTYPMRDIPDPDDPAKKVAKRDGSPICDQYRVNVYESRIIAAVADGCNWGDPPRNAAVAARDAFVSYLEAHQEEITDVQFCGALILRALSMANAAIFRGLNPETQQIGTTTLLGGIVLKMLDEDCDEDGSDGIPEDSHNWGFVYGSIGDCKAFHWSSATGLFQDITASNRTESLSASDCGGRLGPHIQGCLPDLRNLELGFYPCDEGDYFMIVSDGVHDNLDPQHLGFEPLDLGLGGESWATVPDLEVAEESKTRYRLELLQKIIKKEIDSKSPIDKEEREIMRKLTDKVNRSSMDLHANVDETVNRLAPPLDIVRQLTCYCREICAASAEWMRENPSKRLPKDYRLYPGKMDHTTCVCFVVGDRKPRTPRPSS